MRERAKATTKDKTGKTERVRVLHGIVDLPTVLDFLLVDDTHSVKSFIFDNCS